MAMPVVAELTMMLDPARVEKVAFIILAVGTTKELPIIVENVMLLFTASVVPIVMVLGTVT